MKKIKLTQGEYTLVDDKNFKELNNYKWCCGKYHNIKYAMRTFWKGKKQTTILMHRQIMGLKHDDKRQVDHINHNGLDNRKSCNLRICESKQNIYNSRLRKNNTSGFIGVSYDTINKKWLVTARVSGIKTYIGRFGNLKKAASEYNKFILKQRGKFSFLNTSEGKIL